jgi:dTDP-4-dehydrorhamnose reductase
MTSIAITGDNGFLGSYLSDLLTQDQSVLRLNRGTSEKSLNQEGLLGSWKRRILDQTQMPTLLINCAAMTDVNGCESNPDSAFAANAQLPGKLAEICCELGIFMIQISTDAVYGGCEAPSDELADPVPLSVYARSKLDGESRVLVRKRQKRETLRIF